MAPNERLAALSAAGVSIWLDDLSRELLNGGDLERLIADKHVVGVTTNPSICSTRSKAAPGWSGRRPSGAAGSAGSSA